MNPIDVLITTGAIKNTGTLTTAFYKTLGEENEYVRFGYGPLNIWYHTRGQVSGSMYADTINMIHICHQLKNI